MTYEDFAPLFTILYNGWKAQDAFIQSVPPSIREAFFDNEYVGALESQQNALMTQAFKDKDMLEMVDYFLYEFKFGYKISGKGQDWDIQNFDQILNYFNYVYFS